MQADNVLRFLCLAAILLRRQDQAQRRAARLESDLGRVKCHEAEVSPSSFEPDTSARVTCDQRRARRLRDRFSARRGLVAATSSVITLKPASVHGPNEVTIATSVASRPRAIRIRPMRGSL